MALTGFGATASPVAAPHAGKGTLIPPGLAGLPVMFIGAG